MHNQRYLPETHLVSSQIDWAGLRVYSLADDADDAEECSKAAFISQRKTVCN